MTMGIRESWRSFWTNVRVALLTTVLGVALSPVASAQADPNQGAGGPVLVVTSSTSTFGKYYAEILRSEGLNAFAVADVSTVSAATLSSYDAVILAEVTLNATQVSTLTTWVNGGGNLIAMNPDPQLAALLGVTTTASTLSNQYLKFDNSNPIASKIVSDTIQFHGAAKLVTLNGATSLATLYSNATTATSNPAVTLRSVGSNGGQAAMFAFDLARSIVYMRQGNPAWIGQDRDGIAPLRSDDMFYGNLASDPQPNWIDFGKVAIAQADEQQRFLANLITSMTLDRKPLPRFWYFPNAYKAAIVMTGDDHGTWYGGPGGTTVTRFNQFAGASPEGCSVENWECVRGTSYLFSTSAVSTEQASNLTAAGFELGVHILTGVSPADDCHDFTQSSLAAIYTSQISAYRQKYPALPAPVTMRHHCIVWSDWASAAKVELANGIRLDTNYYYWPPGWVNNIPGQFTGSAMPMRFADTDGTLIDVYQAVTQMTDESGQTYPFTVDTLLDRAVGSAEQYGVFTVNAHTDEPTTTASDSTLISAQARGVPIVSAKQMLTWLDGRNSSSFSSIAWNGSALSFSVTQAAGATGLRGLLPQQGSGGATLQTLTRGGVSVDFQLVTIKGVDYVAFPATSGSYVATYAIDNTAPTVTTFSPAASATSVPTYESVKVTFSEPMSVASITTSSIELRNPANSVVPATVTYDSSTRTATLKPSAPLAASTTYTVNVKGGATDPRVKDSSGNALAATQTWTFATWTAPSCNPCSIWDTSTVPGVASTDDTGAVELGVKFTAAIDGVITGLRFYKGPLNTGVHVGKIWAATGGAPIATATFQNETATGWQEVQFSSPVAITANTTYIASYYAPGGGYAITENYFNNNTPGTTLLRPLTEQESGGNGVFKYGAGNTFPDESYLSSNYWIDVMFVGGQVNDTQPPTITSRTPAPNGSASPSTTVTAVFSEAMAAGTIDGTTVQLRDASNALVPATVTYSAATRTATLTPNAPLTGLATYSATVRGGSTPPVVQDAAGNALAAISTWSFTTTAGTTCPCVLWPSTVSPTVVTENDPTPVQLGVKFRSDAAGRITGIRFYKGLANTGVHVGSLWSAAGANLASATFQNETSSGWQEVQFSTPVTIQANTTYIAAYYAPNGYYSADSGYFATNGVDNGVLHAPNNASSGGNGVYVYGTANSFPNETYGSSNYWVQPVFVPGTADSSAPTIAINSPTTSSSYSTSVSPLSLAGVSSDDTGVTAVTWTNSLGGSGTATGTASWTIAGVALQPGLNAITVTATDASNKTASAVLSVTYTPPVDNTPPTVQGVTPTHGSTGAPISGAIIATFSESMLASSVSTSSIELRNASNTLIPTTVTYNSGAFSAQIQPTSALTPNTTYNVRVKGGAADPRVKDVAGNALTADFTWSFTTGTATGCSSSAVAAENCLTGNLQSEWDVTGAGDPSIQGFATSISVNRGETIQFKVNTPATSYRFDIYRMGYYGGRGARFITSFAPSASLPQSQDPCPVQNTTGLIDCGLWKVSASWTVPTTAVSGIYFAKVIRTDAGGGGGASHIVFVVRDDASTSKMVFQTSDTTWQAYNTWGGNSLYQGSPGINPGRAYKVSYNRPFNTRSVDGGQDWVFNAEYPMVRFLEANGYDVSYISGLDSHRSGALLLNHKVFLSVGHDEYWSGEQRTNVEAARAAGVHMAFFSGNEVFWKTRWEPALDGTPNRTLVAYKETHANGKIDPTSTWTGTWRDGRYSSDGGKPENLLTGTLFEVNSGTSSIRVPEAMGKFRFWRGTPVAAQSTNNTAQLPDGTLGYEWDEAPNNGVGPPGLVRMSLATVSGVDALQDLGSTYAIGTATHSITLYKHASGALVFGAGTVQWSWGLDSNHDRGNAPVDISMQQATVNLFADMGVTPGTIQNNLSIVPLATDNTAPTVVLSAPADGATVAVNSNVSISGTAGDVGGKVGAVEVSVDGGTSWFTATGTTSWTYAWKPTALGSAAIRVRSVDDSGNLSAVTSATVTVATSAPVSCPCSFWDNSVVPPSLDDNDAQQIQTGVKFTSSVAGQVTAIRFYKGALNTGTHIGSLWSSTGQLLSSVTFQNETATGWQQMSFPAPITIQPNTVYIASYYSPNGHYPGEDHFFTGNSVTSGPLTAPASENVAGGNGVYKYGPATSFPDETYLGENYWVDVVFTTSGGGSGDTTAPVVALTAPTTGTTYSTSTGTVNLTGTASDAVGVTQVTWTNDRGGNGTATGTTSWSVSNVALQSGTNVITVSGRDAAGNTGTKVLSVTYTPAVADTTNPVVTITSPTSNTTHSTSTTPITIGGSASDNVGVTQVTWSNSLTGGTGTATGTGTWSAAGIALAPGLNTITITARDAAGNLGTDTLGVTYTAPPDTTAPTVTLTSPTTGTTFSTSGTTVNLAGTAADNVGVTQVTWSSNKGISGTATGTTSWSASNVRVVRGSNVLTITARDAAGNTSTPRTLTVTSTAAADSTLPSIAISSPTSSSSYTTTTNQVSLSGTAGDNDLLVGITWSNNRGGSGNATATLPAQSSTSWSVPTIDLQPGVNTVTVTARDLTGNTRVATLNVTFNAPITYGQVGAWNFNEGTGSSVADASGNNNLGTVTNGTWTTSGRFGRALQFNGTNSRVFIPASTSLNLTAGMTMMAWVYPTTNSQTGNRTIIRRESNGYWLYAGRTSLTLRPGGGTYTGTSSTVQANSTILNSALPANQWSHVALTYDGSTMRLYVNGSQVTSTSTSGTIVSGNNPLYIGGTSLGEVFTGRIDEVRLYNRALSAADISTASTTAIP